MRNLKWACLVLLAVAGLAVRAEEKFADISHGDLKAAIAEKKVVLLDANGTESYAKHHIPGALDFAATADLDKVLPADKGALVVAYCGSEKCHAYSKAAEAAAKLGYTNVKHYAAGIAGWLKSGEKAEQVPAVPAGNAKAEGVKAGDCGSCTRETKEEAKAGCCGK